MLLAERPTNAFAEAPALSAVSDDAGDGPTPCPGRTDGLPAASLATTRLPTPRAFRLKDGMPLPEARSLSPPLAL